jgi:hypothetical protein
VYKILKQLDIEVLMRLRYAVDKPEFYHDIDQDIKDLYAYPERLTLTYPDEWNFFIRQQLIKRNISEQALHHWLAFQTVQDLNKIPANDMDLSHIQLSQATALAALVANSESRFIDAKAILSEVQSIQTAPQVTPLIPLLKQQLNKLLDE